MERRQLGSVWEFGGGCLGKGKEDVEGKEGFGRDSHWGVYFSS